MTTNTKIQVSEEDHQQHDIWGEGRGNPEATMTKNSH